MKLMTMAMELASHAMGVFGEAVKHIHFKRQTAQGPAQVVIDFGHSEIVLRGDVVNHLWHEIDHWKSVVGGEPMITFDRHEEKSNEQA